MRNRSGISRKAFAWIFVANVLILIICLLQQGPDPRNNDDTVVYTITSGVHGVASAQLGCINLVFGKLLVALSTLCPTINWLSMLEVAFLFLSFTLLSILFFEHSSNAVGLIQIGLLLLVFAPKFYLNLHYTRCTILFAAAGFLILFWGVLRKRVFWCLAGGTLVFLSSIMRFQAFLVGAAMVFGIGVALLFAHSPEKTGQSFFKRNKDLILITAIVLCAVCVPVVYENHVLQTDEEFAYLRRYNDARTILSDYGMPDYDENREMYNTLGLSHNDYNVILWWSGADTELFPVETLEELAKQYERLGWMESVKKTLYKLVVGDYNNIYTITFLAVTIWGLITTRGSRRCALLAVLEASFLIAIFFSHIGRTAVWVSEGMAAAGFVGASFCICAEKSHRKASIALAGIALICTFGSVVALIHYGIGSYYFQMPKSEKAYFDAFGTDKESLYLHDVNIRYINDRIVYPLVGLPKGYLENVYFLGGWDSASAPPLQKLEKFNVKSPYRALIEKDNVYLIDTFDQTFQMKVTLLREHFSPMTRYAFVMAPCGMQAYTFTDGSVVREGYTKGLPEAFGGISIDPASDSMYQINIALGIEAAKGSVAYVALYEDGDEQTTLQYRVPAEGNLITFSFPVMDLPRLPDTLEAVVYLEEAQEGSIVSDRIPLPYG